MNLRLNAELNKVINWINTKIPIRVNTYDPVLKQSGRQKICTITLRKQVSLIVNICPTLYKI